MSAHTFGTWRTAMKLNYQLLLAGLLLALGSCASNEAKDALCACEGGDKPCECPAPEAAVAEDACDGCAAFMVGGTGWCETCDTGYYEGKEVWCKGGCSANPGGMPCANCVK